MYLAIQYTSLFADDTKRVAVGPDFEHLTEYVNNEFQKINYFFRAHKLSLHPSKTKKNYDLFKQHCNKKYDSQHFPK